MTKTLDLIDTALVTGGAGGIGRAIAETLIRCGKTVVIAGRTESKLKDTAAQIGAAAYYVLDTGDTSQIADVSRRILADYPDLNCLVNNAGVQRPFTFPAAGVGAGAGGKGEADEDGYGFDLAKADQEIDINIRGPLHLTLRFLPHLLALPEGKTGVIMNVSSVLGFLPASVINPVYNGTKAWVHFFTTNLRSQYNLAGKGERLKIIEIAPPSVTTELVRPLLSRLS